MSRHYLLDGYNIIKKVPRFAGAPLRDGRTLLFRWIDARAPHGSSRNTVTVVFDGKPEHFGDSPAGSAKAVFTAGETADDRMKQMLDDARNIKDYVVVSDDKDVKLYARALGAVVMGVREFAPDLFAAAGGKQARGEAGGQSSKKHVSLSQEAKINKELERIWLK